MLARSQHTTRPPSINPHGAQGRPAGPHLSRLLLVLILAALSSHALRADQVSDELIALRQLIASSSELPADSRNHLLSYLDKVRQEHEAHQSSPYAVMEFMEAFMTESVGVFEQLASPQRAGIAPQQGDEFVDQFMSSYVTIMSWLFFGAGETRSTAQPLPDPGGQNCSAAILWRYMGRLMTDPGPILEVPFGSTVQLEARTTAGNPSFSWAVGPWEDVAFAAEGNRFSLFMVNEMTLQISVSVQEPSSGAVCEDKLLVRGKGRWID